MHFIKKLIHHQIVRFLLHVQFFPQTLQKLFEKTKSEKNNEMPMKRSSFSFLLFMENSIYFIQFRIEWFLTVVGKLILLARFGDLKTLEHDI